MTQRERFEAWFLDNFTFYGVAKYKSGQYVAEVTQAAWQGYQAACPEGWRAVPKEPTNPMMEVETGFFVPDQESMRDIYLSMLAAAPKPEDV